MVAGRISEFKLRYPVSELRSSEDSLYVPLTPFLILLSKIRSFQKNLNNQSHTKLCQIAQSLAAHLGFPQSMLRDLQIFIGQEGGLQYITDDQPVCPQSIGSALASANSGTGSIERRQF